jgi:multidrug transporter EmrE-like cation transporter
MSLPQIVALSAIEVIGDVGFKEYANKGGIANLAQGIIGYIGVMALLVINLQGSTLLLVNGAWDGISCLIESIYVYLFLGERFDDFSQYIGLVFIVIGISLLKIPMSK